LGIIQTKVYADSPASGVLMTVMREIYVDFEDFMIVIFDNMLVLAHDFNVA
jgi:hypothetical protein